MVVTDRRGKRIIDRRLDHDGVACPGQRADGGTDGEDDARRFDEPFFFDFPVVPAREPALYGFEIAGLGFAVTVNGVIDHFLQGSGHGRRTPEVHVGDPHREDVFRFAAFFGEIILDRACIGPVDDFIEIVRGKTACAPAG